MLFFLHVPKTAGTSVRHAFEARAPQRLVPVYNDQPGKTLDKARARATADSIVFGHFHYGVHRRFEAAPNYATILRNPIDRIISWYTFVQAQPGNPNNALARRHSLCELVQQRQSVELSNHMTSIFAGRRLHGADDTQALETAKANLETFLFVSVQEHIATDLARLEQLTGVALPRLGHANKSASTPDEPNLRETIQAHNALDWQLYTHALALRTQQPSPA